MSTNMTLLDARTDYYRANGFGDDGGDSLDWVPIKIWKLTIKIPNSKARKRAVKVHDLHHVVTGYRTDLRGEAEIAAWELASGCGRVPVAFVLNLFAFAIGVLIAPGHLLRAWARGRATKNLYAHATVDALLPQNVNAVRTSLGLDGKPPAPRGRDVATFTLVTIVALALMLALIVGPLVGIFAGLGALANAIA